VGEASFITNIGGLVQPTTMETYRGGAQRCFGLFSHNDQTNGAQTLQCQFMGTGAMGVGGRIADALSAGTHQMRTSSFSMSGAATWSQGFQVKRESVAGIEDGVTDYEYWRGTIRNVTSVQHANVYANAYTQLFLDSVETMENTARVVSNVELLTEHPTNTGLARQFEQVAKLVSSQEGRQAERDFFYVAIGGWDMHSNLKMGLVSRFGEINGALQGFVAEMRAQSVWNNVVVMSESEFARTLDSNGGGSDHAWAGNHFVIGGGLNGGKVLNRYPASVAAGNPRDLGRGRLIPEFPWESMVVPVAEWLGVDADLFATAFPNLHGFGSEDIIPVDVMFNV